MDNVYRTIHKYGENEIVINKSRFIGYAKPIESEQEALDFIEGIKSKHRDATHNVYAYVYGEIAIFKGLVMMGNHLNCRNSCFRGN